jgi:hypothetical protein
MHFANEKAMLEHIVISWVSEPVDHLWLHLEFLDERHSLLSDLQHDGLNPFVRCMVDLSRFLTVPMKGNDLSTIYKRYMDDAVLAKIFTDRTRTIAASLICQIDWRLASRYKGWPYPLTKRSDIRCSEIERWQVIKDMFDAPTCCLDPWFAAKVVPRIAT